MTSVGPKTDRSRPRCRPTLAPGLAVCAAAVFASLTPTAAAQEKVTTCIAVDAPESERQGLERLVASEVDRHPSHRAVPEGCAAHLRIELITIDGNRFLTGRIGGEVPDRVRVDGAGAKALENALGDLLRTVLGTDPVALHAPEGRSWLGAQVFSLKERGRDTFDVAPAETVSLVLGHASFNPGLLLGFSREIENWQVGVEALVAQNLDRALERADLDTELRLQATVTLFFGGDSDVSAFAGVSAGLAYERFTGPRGQDLGGGDGAYGAAIPGVGFRVGLELFRTTSMRADLLAEAFLPVIPVNDVESEVIQGWVPTFSLAAGARF